MGRLIPFRRRRKARDSGAKERTLRFWPDDDRVTVRGVARETVQWLGKLRPFILGGIVLSVWPAMDPALVEPPGFLSTEPETIDAQFTRCGPGRGHVCVIDGDTFKIGERRIRIIGIDTPEVKAQCEAEAIKAEEATAELQRLLNQGPFEMVGRKFGDTDRYGRDLRVVRRKMRDGSYQSIAEEMRESGVARRYMGGFRSGWC